MIKDFGLQSVIQGSIMAAAFAVALISTPVRSQQRPEPPNKVVGTWAPASLQAEIGGKMVDLQGTAPAGSLIFTQNLRFSVIIHDPRLPRFASEDRAKAMQSETLAAATSSLALYGTYTVGNDGQFFDQVVEGSTFPNWNGLKRGQEQLTLNADGDVMTEHFANHAPWTADQDRLETSGDRTLMIRGCTSHAETMATIRAGFLPPVSASGGRAT